MADITPDEAKRLIASILAEHGMQARLRAHTVSFSDLARASCVFVSVEGLTPGPIWTTLKDAAKACGFCIEA